MIVVAINWGSSVANPDRLLAVILILPTPPETTGTKRVTFLKHDNNALFCILLQNTKLIDHCLTKNSRFTKPLP